MGDESPAGSGSFPDGFLWGAATSSYQVEGGNVNSDWWDFEHDPTKGCLEPSGDACDSWNRWNEDVALVADLGLNAYRFSLEWSRIEPAEGEWSLAALDHYRRMCAACRGLGLTPVVTFNHFTLPRWLAAEGGWEAPGAAERFARYVGRANEHLGDLIGRACTINEPNIVAVMGYVFGAWPPGVNDPQRRSAVTAVLADAHRRAVEALRSGPSRIPVGLALSMTDYQALPGGEHERDGLRSDMEDAFFEAARGDDFLGVQAYTRLRIGENGLLGPEKGVPVTPLGYEVWPQAIEATLRRASEVTGGMPLLVTENGLATDVDAERKVFVAEALAGVLRCLADGVDVRGYCYWSLLDNFEWSFGYLPRFGLVGVDRRTFERRPKPSATWLGRVARANAMVDQ